MTKFNKSLLTAAVVGALALPSIASAATLSYNGAKQITFAKDLIVNNGTTINTPNSLRLAGEATSDAQRLASVAANTNVTFKVTLTNQAKFDSTADATTLVEGFFVGTQLGASAARKAGSFVETVPNPNYDSNQPIDPVTNPQTIDETRPSLIVGTPYYSASGQELNFTIKAPGAGNAGNGYALELNSKQITNLETGLLTDGTISAEITAQNSNGTQILAARAEIAKSAPGLVFDANTNTASVVYIEASAGSNYAGKTRFSSSRTPGGSITTWANVGAITVDVNRVAPTGGGSVTPVNNYSAVANNPQYNVVGTAVFDIEVTGANLSAFNYAGGIFLSNSSTCSTTGAANGSVSTDYSKATWSLSANHGLLTNVSAANPTVSTLHVCVAGNTVPMVAQPLNGKIGVNYNLPTQRVNPDPKTFALASLKTNGSDLVFQNVNPAGNATAQSFIRMTNNNAVDCPVVIDAKDDAGKHSGEVKFTLGAHQSKQLNSEHLEGRLAASGVTGSFGDGTGKWYVRIQAECTNFKASALNRHQDGVVTNLTPEKDSEGTIAEWLTPSVRL